MIITTRNALGLGLLVTVGSISLMFSTGCHTPASHKPSAAGNATPPPPVAVVATNTPPAPPVTVAVTNKPGFFSWIWGAKETAAPSKPVDTDRPFTTYHIQVGDSLLVSLRSITPEQPNIELVVDENGEIKLPYINAVKAEGKTTSELENLIRDTYLVQQIYKRITVNVIVPSQTSPTFYVKGEVRSPGRLPYVNGMTLLSAVAAAGGPTDYASTDMILLRGKTKLKFNYHKLENHPEQDQPIQAGDIIIIDKSMF